ncbi:MAG: hypothetical protein R3F24_05130 [Gammaproteobacteria bacterium]
MSKTTNGTSAAPRELLIDRLMGPAPLVREFDACIVSSGLSVGKEPVPSEELLWAIHGLSLSLDAAASEPLDAEHILALASGLKILTKMMVARIGNAPTTVEQAMQDAIESAAYDGPGTAAN